MAHASPTGEGGEEGSPPPNPPVVVRIDAANGLWKTYVLDFGPTYKGQRQESMKSQTLIYGLSVCRQTLKGGRRFVRFQGGHTDLCLPLLIHSPPHLHPPRPPLHYSLGWSAVGARCEATTSPSPREKSSQGSRVAEDPARPRSNPSAITLQHRTASNAYGTLLNFCVNSVKPPYQFCFNSD